MAARQPRQGCAWRSREDKLLQLHWGVSSLAAIAKKLGRTVAGVTRRGLKLGLDLKRHGLTPQGQLARESGYGWHTIHAAIRALGLELQPLPSRGARSGTGESDRTGLDEEQVEAVLAYLKERGERRQPHGLRINGRRDRWGTGKQPDACLRCKRDDRPHHSHGHCHPCSSQVWRQENPMAARQQRKRLTALRRARKATRCEVAS